MKLLGSYQNGNYSVSIFDDGTKIRENDLDFFEPEFPESMDLKITNQCDMGCPMCHEDSKPDGVHGDILNLPFIDSLKPFTEIAIGGGNPLSHPDLIPFLQKLKDRNIIASMTVNQIHFEKQQPLLSELTEQGLIHGLGISVGELVTNRASMEGLIQKLKKFPNAVLHVINGVISVPELELIRHNNLKILILGYKDFRRGHALRPHISPILDARQRDLKETLPYMISDKWFDVISFDNLAIRQLDVRSLMPDKQHWDEFYMGDDGNFTMYVDAVKQEFAVCSVAEERFPVTDNIQEMFHNVRNRSRGEQCKK